MFTFCCQMYFSLVFSRSTFIVHRGYALFCIGRAKQITTHSFCCCCCFNYAQWIIVSLLCCFNMRRKNQMGNFGHCFLCGEFNSSWPDPKRLLSLLPSRGMEMQFRVQIDWKLSCLLLNIAFLCTDYLACELNFVLLQTINTVCSRSHP